MKPKPWKILLPGVPSQSPRGAMGWCSVVLFRSGNRNIIFDTGSYGDRPALLESLQREDLAPKDIDMVVISHFHYDHVVNAEVFPRAPILISELEYCYVMEGGYLRVQDPWVPRSYIAMLGDRLILTGEGEYLGEGLKTILLPGHTPGNMGLILEDSEVLCTGDAIKHAWGFVRNVPPPHFTSEEICLGTYRKIRSHAKLVIPGHDRPFVLLPEGIIPYMPACRDVTVEVYNDPGKDELTQLRIW